MATALAAGGSGPGNKPFNHGRFDIRIGYDGRWYYRGSPIERKPLVKLFSSVLKRDDEGQFWLETPAEKGLIEVEDAPFVIVEAEWRDRGAGQVIALTTNVDDTVPLDAAHPLRVVENPATGEPRPYVTVRDGLEALVSRPVFYELADDAVPGDDDAVGVWSGGVFHPLGRV